MDPAHTIIVGGHSRNIGKTALVVDILRAFPAANWTAVKITQYGHGVCSVNGEHCGCAPAEHPFAINEETDRTGKSDTSRFLLAGAQRALWVRTKQGQLAAALPEIREAVAGAEHLMIESNTLLGFLRPRLYLVVLDPTVADFKESAQRNMDLASAFVLRSVSDPSRWQPGLVSLMERKPQFYQPLGSSLPLPLVDLVRSSIAF